MDIFTLILLIITLAWFLLSLIKKRELIFESMKISRKMMSSMMPQIVGILFLIGLIMTFIPPDVIKEYLGGSSPFKSSIIAAIIGSITLIPAFVAFPLVGSIIDMGASVTIGVSFLTTLTMVGFVTFNLEKKEFGLKFALSRNILSFIFAILIAVIMGVFL